MKPYQETRAIVNCCHNIVKKNLKLKNKQLQKLRPLRTQIKILSDPKISISNKNKFLNQKDNKLFLTTLLSAILPILIQQINV